MDFHIPLPHLSDPLPPENKADTIAIYLLIAMTTLIQCVTLSFSPTLTAHVHEIYIYLCMSWLGIGSTMILIGLVDRYRVIRSMYIELIGRSIFALPAFAYGAMMYHYVGTGGLFTATLAVGLAAASLYRIVRIWVILRVVRLRLHKRVSKEMRSDEGN